jgi:hypothetical protein
LPEGELSESEQGRQQPIPQMHDDLTADDDRENDEQRDQDNPFQSTHCIPHFLKNSS